MAKQRDAVFHPEFREDLVYWVKTDRKVSLKVFELIEATLRDPFNGIGSPSRSSISTPGRGRDA